MTSDRQHNKVFADRTYSGDYGGKGEVLASYVWTQEESFADRVDVAVRKIASVRR